MSWLAIDLSFCYFITSTRMSMSIVTQVKYAHAKEAAINSMKRLPRKFKYTKYEYIDYICFVVIELYY